MQARHCGDFIDRATPIQRRDNALTTGCDGIGVDEVYLVQHQPPGSGCQRRTEALQLTHHCACRISRVTAVNRGNINEMQ